MNSARGTRRVARGVVVSLALCVVFDLVLNHTVLSDGQIFGRRIAPFDPPLFNVEQDASLDRLRALATGGPATGAIRYDSELGWTTPTLEHASDSYFDELGARRPVASANNDSIANPGEEAPKILLLGCSVTYGDEVLPEETWAQKVELELGARVANCGVSAYGIDQALLRLRRIGGAARPKEVWLGILPKALLRVLSIYRPAMRHHEPSVSFKPRFEINTSSQLTLIPNPAPTPADAVLLLTRRGAFFEAVRESDTFVSDHPHAYAPLGSYWSHHSAIARLLLTHRENRSRPSVELELNEPTSDLSRLVESIVFATRDECVALGARLRVIVFPDADDLVAARGGKPPITSFVKRMRDGGIEMIDVSAALLAAGAQPDPLWFRPGGHYAPRANEVIGVELARIAR